MLELSFVQSLVLVRDVFDSYELHRMGLLQRVLEFSQVPGHLEHQRILTFLQLWHLLLGSSEEGETLYHLFYMTNGP